MANNNFANNPPSLKQEPQYLIIGSGAFGSALGAVLCQKYPTILACRNPDLAQHINQYHNNKTYLPAIQLPMALKASASAEKLAPFKNRIIFAVPAQKMRDSLSYYRAFIAKEAIIILCAKGIEKNSHLFMHEIAAEFFPHSIIALLSGPSFASELARGLPTALTIASDNIQHAELLAKEISHNKLRCYASSDMVGIALGGALKNIFALGAGFCHGQNWGENAKAALLTRAFAEMRRLARTLGAREQSLSGLAGFGDLLLSATSASSRNYRYGMALAGKELELKDDVKNKPSLSEGALSVNAACFLCRKYQIKAPLLFTIEKIVNKELEPQQALEKLFSRPIIIED